MKPPLSVLLLIAAFVGPAARANSIFPPPQSLEALPRNFRLDDTVSILIPPQATPEDLFLGRFLSAEVSDRYGIAVRSRTASSVPPGSRVILMGSIANPLIRTYCEQHGIKISASDPGPEGYVLEVTPGLVLIAGSDHRGAYYGLQSLRQLIERTDHDLTIPGVRVRDWPQKSFRGIKLYLPGRNNIPFFKRFVRDFLGLYKYNRVIVEMNAGMRLERHPELNAGWVEFARDLVRSRRDRPAGPHEQFQDSSHQDTADGGVLEQEDVADLVRWARRHYIEVIPELPSLTHSYYLLTRHRELAEIRDAEWPDTYCPSNPQSYKLLFDVLDEYIGVMKPRLMHVGHDEWRMPVGVCPLCRGKDPRDLFAADVNRIHDYLARKGVRMAIWGDHLLQDLRGEKTEKHTTSTGWAYDTPGGLTPAQVKKSIPKDILIFNWFWSESSAQEGGERSGEKYEADLAQWGFQQVYGNFTPGMKDYGRRSAVPSILGAAPSAWVATNEFNFGKDLVSDFAACAAYLWSKRQPEPADLSRMVGELMPAIRRNLSGEAPPSDGGDPVISIDLPATLTAPSAGELLGFDPTVLKTGRVANGKKLFELSGRLLAARSGPARNPGHPDPVSIPVGEDPSSLLFLHACARPASNEAGYRTIFNFPDTADLLGWYEVVYEDGFVESIPIRYGMDILEWNPHATPGSVDYCYRGDPVDCGGRGPASFVAFEWVNPRFGKSVKEVRLRGSVGFRNYLGKDMGDNAVILAALSYVKKKARPGQ